MISTPLVIRRNRHRPHSLSFSFWCIILSVCIDLIYLWLAFNILFSSKEPCQNKSNTFSFKFPIIINTKVSERVSGAWHFMKLAVWKYFHKRKHSFYKIPNPRIFNSPEPYHTSLYKQKTTSTRWEKEYSLLKKYRSV